MKRSSAKMLFGAAIAAASMVAVPAMGQTRVNGDGHAIDANQRVGSGGINDNVSGGGVSQNNIIFNNVTGGIGFTGPVLEGNGTEFEGPDAGRLNDNFVRTSAGVPTPYQSSNVANAPQAYYGSSQWVAPPIGTERWGTTGGYVGTGATQSNVNPLLAQVTAALDQQKQSSFGESAVLGAGTNLINQNTLNSDQNPSSPLDANIQPSIYNLSPLFGVNALPGTDGATDDNSSNSLFGSSSLTPGGAGRQCAQRADIAKMRSEVLQQQNGTSDDQQSQNPNLLPGGFDQKPYANPLDASLNPADKNGGNNQVGKSTLNNTINTQQGINEKITTQIPGRQQSASVRQFQDQQNQYKTPLLRQLEAYAKQANDRAAMTAKSAPGGMPTTQPAGGPIGLPGGRGTSIPSLPSSVPALPPSSSMPGVKIDSLAEGVKATGLHDLLNSAEALMRQDKFQSAIAKYNTAEDVAPKDSLIPLGRANAELGAGYYNQASVDLHQVFESSPATLFGQYDLTKWMNEKRLDFVVSDLLALSKADKAQEMPEFLLAYLLYNTGRPGEAAEHLQRAKARAGTKDPLLGELETRWKLPDTGGAAKPSSDLNK